MQATVDTIMCHKSDMNVLGHSFTNFCNAIDSAPARYKIILKYHPFIRERSPTEILPTGYIFGYSNSLFRCEYKVHSLYHHIEICSFNIHALQSFVKLRCMISDLKKLYNVS